MKWIINDNTAISLGLVILIVYITVYINTIKVQNAALQSEVDRLAIFVKNESDNKWNTIYDQEKRLSHIEGQLTNIEKWCREIVQEFREQKKLRK